MYLSGYCESFHELFKLEKNGPKYLKTTLQNLTSFSSMLSYMEIPVFKAESYQHLTLKT